MAKNYKPTDSLKTDVNILMLGETGVGKSTFINSFVNYLDYTTLETARANDVQCLIPTKFSIPDENFEDRIVEIGEDKNEDKEIGNSSTQDAKAYVFPIQGESRSIRIIDTPGIGDARGLDQDKINFENVLSFISQFTCLHAICILLKPNVSVINPYFKFCLMHLFAHLEKSASKNIVFVFTNSRSTFYRPGETLAVLRKLLVDIEQSPPFVKIPCTKENLFCVDNEAFKFLVALKAGIKFGDREIRNYSSSWEISTTASWNLLSYIAGDMNQTGLVPHQVQNTISVNEARRLISDLSKPVADISELIQTNLTVLGRHQDFISQSNISIRDLQSSLYVPAVFIKEKTLTQPVTVCTAHSCCETYPVNGVQQYHYKQRCHNPCYLTNVPQKLRGAPELMHCAAMKGTSRCTVCKCDFSVHMHIMYETELVSDRLEDDTVRTRITTNQEAVQAKSKLITKLQKRSDEYEKEKKVIVETMAKFAHFLQTHSITVYNDAYLDYIEYLIEREKGLGSQKNKDMINRYEQLKRQYIEEKQVLENSSQNSTKLNLSLVSAVDVFTSVKSLYTLKHTGSKIKQLHSKQEKARNDAHEKTMEYYHPREISKKNDPIPISSSNDGFDILQTILQEKDLEAAQLMLSTLSVNDDTRKKVSAMAQTFFQNKNTSSQENPKNSGNSRNKRQNNLPNHNSHRTTQNVQQSPINHRPNQQFKNRSNNQCNPRPNRQFNQGPNHQFNQGPNHQFNQGPNHQFNQGPNHQFNQGPNHQFNQRPKQQFNRRPNQQYNREYNQQYNHNPNQQFNHNPNHQFNHNPNQRFNRGTNHGFQDNQNPQYNPQHNPQYNPQQNLQYNPQNNPQYNPPQNNSSQNFPNAPFNQMPYQHNNQRGHNSPYNQNPNMDYQSNNQQSNSQGQSMESRGNFNRFSGSSHNSNQQPRRRRSIPRARAQMGPSNSSTEQTNSSTEESSSSSDSDDTAVTEDFQQEILRFIQSEIDRQNSEGKDEKKSTFMFFNK